MVRKTIKTWKCFGPPRSLHHDTLLWSVCGRGAQNVFTGTSESCVQTRFRSKGSGKLLPCCPAKNNEALIAIKVVQRKHSLLWDDRMGPNYHDNILVLQYLGTWLRVSGGQPSEQVCGKWGKIDYVRNKRPSISYCNLNLWLISAASWEQQMTSVHPRVAVRSSGLGEDGVEASAAGQNETLLGVRRISLVSTVSVVYLQYLYLSRI